MIARGIVRACLVAFALVFALSSTASAKMLVVKVTPAQLNGWKVSTKAVGDALEYTVSVRDVGQLRKGASVFLDIKDAKNRRIAVTPLAPLAGQKGPVTFRFSVGRAYLRTTTFIYQWIHATMPSGDRYEMVLADFP